LRWSYSTLFQQSAILKVIKIIISSRNNSNKISKTSSASIPDGCAWNMNQNSILGLKLTPECGPRVKSKFQIKPDTKVTLKWKGPYASNTNGVVAAFYVSYLSKKPNKYYL
jgi:hypothetical protein